MASNKGLILGVGILGISAIALMNMDTSTTSSLPQSGGVSGTSPNTDGDDNTDDADDWDAPDCSLVYNSNGERINNTWVYHGMVSAEFSRSSCDLNGFRCKVYTDKRNYIAGESINVLILKSYYETDYSNEWRPWSTQTKVFGEKLAFMLGLESTDGYNLYNFQHTIGKEIAKGANDDDGGWERGNVDKIPMNGDLKSHGWPWTKHGNLGVCMLTLSTSKADVGEYMVRFAGELGPYQSGSPCGASSCLHTTGSDCNNREATSNKLITIITPDCKNESSAESNKQAESKNILRAEHFIQSYQQNWV